MNIDTLIITHGIKGFKNHVMSGNELWVMTNCEHKRTQHIKMLKLQLNGLTRGYFINRKFRSLTWIEKRLYPLTKVIVKKEKLPF